MMCMHKHGDVMDNSSGQLWEVDLSAWLGSTDLWASGGHLVPSQSIWGNGGHEVVEVRWAKPKDKDRGM